MINNIRSFGRLRDWTVGRLRDWTVGSRPSLVTKALAEFTGCMIFHFIGSVAPTAATNAISLLVLVYYTARMSGAHLNPALTMTFAILGYTNPVEVIVYWMAQFVGCIFGALWVSLLVPRAYPEYDGCFHVHESMSDWMIVGWEAIGTFCFILPIFSVVWYTQHKSGYGNTGPIIVGFSLYAAASAVGPWTGAALNPARVVASPVVIGCRDSRTIPYYVAGEIIGAILVPIAIVPWYGVSSKLFSRDYSTSDDDVRDSSSPPESESNLASSPPDSNLALSPPESNLAKMQLDIIIDTSDVVTKESSPDGHMTEYRDSPNPNQSSPKRNSYGRPMMMSPARLPLAFHDDDPSMRGRVSRLKGLIKDIAAPKCENHYECMSRPINIDIDMMMRANNNRQSIDIDNR